MLFKDAPDLIVEFKNFLPDAVPPGQEAMIPMGSWPQPQQPQPLPPSPQPAKKAAPVKRKKRVLEKEPTPVPPPQAVKTAPRVRSCMFWGENALN
jgi:paired amphipathic helix protein Sin3a